MDNFSVLLVCVGLWTFLWFVGFCYMTDAWRRTPSQAPWLQPHNVHKDNIQAAIAFSFFSIFTWVSIQCYLAYGYKLSGLLWSCKQSCCAHTVNLPPPPPKKKSYISQFYSFPSESEKLLFSFVSVRACVRPSVPRVWFFFAYSN
jgi:hypothetical protein